MNEMTVGLIGGTGLGEALGAEGGNRHDVETPFGKPSDAIVETQWAGTRVLLLSRHRPGHLLNPSQINYRANIFALKQLGCTHLLASGAVGSLRDEFRPRDLVVPDQIIDRTTRRAATFFENAAVHVEFAEPFDLTLRQVILEAASLNPAPFQSHNRGCYVCMEGPAFSTRAESLMHRLWGGDLIGMTAMPEAKLAREAEIPYALLALVTDYDCWRAKSASTELSEQQKVDPNQLLKEIQGNLKAASEAAATVMRKTVEVMATQRERLTACPALHALELGIWSDKSRIDRSEVQKLRPLWGKYFPDVNHES
jgi:5'-methylthioadenosine phosphorylase